KQASFQVDGVMADGSPVTYFTLAISQHAGETEFPAEAINLQRERAGADGQDGDIVGPNGATAGNLATFADSSGKRIEDSGIAASNVYRAGGTAVAVADGGTGA